MSDKKRITWEFKGVMAPTFAPLLPNGDLNIDVVPKYASFLHEAGVKGVFLNGTLGEGATLTLEERITLVDAWLSVKETAGTIVVHVGGTNISDVKTMARHAEANGVDAIAVMSPPYYHFASDGALLEYLREVSTAAPETPLLYYHFPDLTNVMPANFQKFLCDAKDVIPTFVGMKFTSTDVAEVKRCMDVDGPNLTVLFGYDQSITAARRLGYQGCINGSFNFMPLEAGKLFFLTGEEHTATESYMASEIPKMQQMIDTIWDIMKAYGNGFVISAAKVVMAGIAGIEVGPPRPPALQLEGSKAKELVEEIRTILTTPAKAKEVEVSKKNGSS